MDLQDFVTQLERILRIGITIIAAYLVALWIASVWWTFRDIRARTTDIFLQVAATLLVAVFSFPGLLIYVILRPPKTLAQLYEDSLEEEAFLQGIQVHNSCPVCKQRVEPEFILTVRSAASIDVQVSDHLRLDGGQECFHSAVSRQPGNVVGA